MRSKYGEESIECVSTWIKDYGFPPGGSLSVNQLEKLENRLTEVEKKMMDRKKVKVKDFEKIGKHKRCLKAWKGEAERRERKSNSKQMPKVTSKMKSDKSSFPCSPLFKVDPDLDTYPPPYNPEEDSKSKLKKKEIEPSKKATAPIAGPSSSSAQGGSSTSSAGVDGTVGGGQHVTTRSQTKMGSKKDVQAEASSEAELADEEEISSLPEDKPEIANLPMIQVAGPRGPSLVHRAWTSTDIQNARGELPPLSAGGLKMAEGLYIFCKEWQPTENELKRLLLKYLGAANFTKIKNAFGNDDRRPKEADWEEAGNYPYLQLLDDLVKRLTENFPVQIDMTKITTCKQGQRESVEDYYTRLHGVYVLHNGSIEPTDLGPIPGPWETHLRNAFVAGLRPNIGEKVKQSCIDWEHSRLTDLMRHARHVEKHCTAEKNKTEHVRLQMAKLQAVEQQSAQPQPQQQQQQQPQQLTAAQPQPQQQFHSSSSFHSSSRSSSSHSRSSSSSRSSSLHSRSSITAAAAAGAEQTPWLRGRGGRGGRGHGRGSGGPRRPPLLKDQCSFCGGFGHWASQCPQNQHAGGGPQCSICGRFGHLAFQCPQNQHVGGGHAGGRQQIAD